MIDANFGHLSNALPPIVVTLFGMVMDVKEEQKENALFSIVVTLFGMVMDVKEEHSINASSPIVVTLFGIEKLLSFFPAG